MSIHALLALALATAPHANSTRPAAAAAAPAAVSNDGLVSTERAIETNSAAVLLPTSDGGPVGFVVCAQCAAERHATDANTRYLAGALPVSRATLAGELAHPPVVAMTVYLDVRTGTVTRVVAHLPPVIPH